MKVSFREAFALCISGAAFTLALVAAGCGSKGPDDASRAQIAQELQQLRQTNQELQKMRAEIQDHDLERLRRDNKDLAHLRPVVDELPKLRQENDQLRAELQSLKPTP